MPRGRKVSKSPRDLPPRLKQAFIKATDAQIFLPLQPVGWWVRRDLAWNWDPPSLKVYGS